jgi:hypothetical protein
VQAVSGAPQAGFAAAEAAALERVFAGWGWECELCVTGVEGGPESRLKIDAGDLLIYHVHNLAPLEEPSEHPRERTVVVLHQLVQPLLLQICEPLTPRLRSAWEQLRSLAEGCELAIGHSAAACGWLEKLGYRRVRRLPFLVDEGLLAVPPDPVTMKMLEGTSPLLLFAGDVVDSASLTDLIKMVWYCRNFSDPGARLVIAGAVDLCPAYFAWQRDLVHERKMEDEVIFLGAPVPEQSAACLRAADIYVQFSGANWTGAGPLLAMKAGLPVVAFSGAAATEVLEDAGVLLETTIHSAAAEEIHRLAEDGEWRKRVVERQKERLERFSEEAIAFQLRTLLERFGPEYVVRGCERKKG